MTERQYWKNNYRDKYQQYENDFCSHNPHVVLIENHLNQRSKCLCHYFSKYDNFIGVGSFNLETSKYTHARSLRKVQSHELIPEALML